MLYPENNTEIQIEKDYDWGEIQRHYANGGMFGRETYTTDDEDFKSCCVSGTVKCSPKARQSSLLRLGL